MKNENPFSVFEQTSAWLQSQNIPFAAAKEHTSTNDWAKAEAFEISAPLKIYLADQQTHGRGRGNNKWLNSHPGTALLLTYSLSLEHPPQSITAPLIGLCLYE